MFRHTNHQDSVDRAFDSLLAVAVEAYGRKQKAFQEAIGPFASWSLNDAGDRMSFVGDHVAPMSVRVTAIATYLPNQGDWAWAWANDVFPEQARGEASLLKTLSAKTEYKIFETPTFSVSTQDIDELCALALHELNGRAIFKVKDHEPWCIFVVHDEL